MKILLSYSYHHFDPSKPAVHQQERNQSAGIIARSLYEVLSALGEVTYTDASHYKKHGGEKFDLFVGIISHFQEIIDQCDIKKSVLVAVNMHPLERNEILSAAIRDLNLSQDAIAPQDILLQPELMLKAIDQADFILCAGNMTTYNSYLKHGVAKSKIKLFNYGLLEKHSHLGHHKKDERRYLYAASEIGLRKGFDFIYEIFMDDKMQSGDFHLDLVGAPSTSYYEAKIKNLEKRLGPKLTSHGWLNSSLADYRKVVEAADFLLFPSLEEGQAGTVIDALASGAVPILSRSTGIDFSPLGNFEISGSGRLRHNIALIENSLKLDEAELEDLRAKTIEYYTEYHQDFLPNIKQFFTGVIEDQIYPTVSIVLAIYNKQETIKGLLTNLDIALSGYPAVDMHIIFDGCSDKSEPITRKFYRNRKSYRVTYERTDNIFEVKSNNLGLRKSSGKYCVIVQDDNYIYDRNFLYETVSFLDKNATAVVLGGLAGVNFYPLSTRGLKGLGQIVTSDDEVYWRQDEHTNPALKSRIFQVDACMRGPLILRKSFLEEHGYLDEAYAPLYNDDMDLCMRASSLGFKVYCILLDVENKSLSMTHSDPKKSRFFEEILKRNSATLYARWRPTNNKNYSWVNRTPILEDRPVGVLKNLKLVRGMLHAKYKA